MSAVHHSGKTYTRKHLLPPNGYVFTSIDAEADGFHVVATLTPTPEPATLSLIALAAGSLLGRRRRWVSPLP